MTATTCYRVATALFAFSALLTWHLGELARSAPGAVGPLGWGLALVQVFGFVLSWMYFSPPPAVFSAVLAALLGVAAWLVRSTPVKGL